MMGDMNKNLSKVIIRIEFIAQLPNFVAYSPTQLNDTITKVKHLAFEKLKASV